MDETGRTEILMATFNGERYLREQIESILAQKDQDWKLIISDDGSSDRTPEIIGEYAKNNPERILLHHSGKRYGNARDHFFHLINISKADYLFFSDQDDVWKPEKAEKTLTAMNGAEKTYGKNTPILVFSDLIPVDQDMRPLGKSLMEYQKQYADHLDFQSLLLQNVVTGGSMAVNRALISKAMKCADPDHVIMHDGWLAMTAARFGKIIYLEETLGFYRQHDRNTIGAKHVGSLKYWIVGLLNSNAVKESIVRKKNQAKVFRVTYEKELNKEEICFLKQFEKPRSGFTFYWKNRKRIHSTVRKIGFFLFG